MPTVDSTPGKPDVSKLEGGPILGMTGEFAMRAMSKRAKKKFLEEKKKEEEEEKTLKERILKAKQDYEADKKRKEIEERA